MTKVNKKSLEAKSYINCKVNDMREQFHKASDEETRKQLVENFRGTTSSEEYKENLKITHEDTDIIRKHAKRKKWWEITPEEFKDAKTEFYGKDMNLDFWEDFEKIDWVKKIDYIFEKFWDTDYAADLIMGMFYVWKLNYSNYWWNEMDYKRRLLSSLFRKSESYYRDMSYAIIEIFEKFGAWQVWLRLGLFFADAFTWTAFDPGLYDKIENYVDRYKWNITQNTVKCFLRCNYKPRNLLLKIISCCKDWSISDPDILDALLKFWGRINLKKISIKWQKYLIDKDYSYAFDNPIADWNQNIINEDLNLWDNVDVRKYIINSMLTKNKIDSFCRFGLDSCRSYHKEIADLLVQMWRIDVVKKYIDKFDWLTAEERVKILWDTELEYKLNKEKFDADLIKLQELWAKLWKEIVVKNVKKEKQECFDESKESLQEPSNEAEKTERTERTPQEPKNKKRKWFRNK